MIFEELNDLLFTKTFVGRWLRKLAVCVVFVISALYIVTPSAHTSHSSQRNASNPQAKLAPPQISAPPASDLQINSVTQHGHIVEIQGSTDPRAVVMINERTATTIFNGNSFRHFLGPLPSGTSIITVTSQDEQGGVNTQQFAVTVGK